MKILAQIPSLTRREVGTKALAVADAIKGAGRDVTVILNPPLRPAEIIEAFAVRNLTVEDFVVGVKLDHDEYDVWHENDLAREYIEDEPEGEPEFLEEPEGEPEGEVEEDEIVPPEEPTPPEEPPDEPTPEPEPTPEEEIKGDEDQTSADDIEGKPEPGDASEKTEYCECGAGPYSTGGLRVHKSRYCEKKGGK